MPGYTVRDVASVLGVSPARVRSYAGFLSPARGPRGELRFSFQDLVLLRAARELVAARVPAAKVKRGLAKLAGQLPEGRPLSAVRISADGRGVAVRDGGTVWNPESGQLLFDFAVGELAAKAAPIARRSAAAAREREREIDAEEWFRLGSELEAVAPTDARDAYRRAVELDPRHADAHVNLGRLLHELGEVAAAETHYRVALAERPGDATAAFDLGVVLEDQGRLEEAAAAYEGALASEPAHADAHFNLSRLHEKAGRKAAAIRHLAAYRRLIHPRR